MGLFSIKVDLEKSKVQSKGLRQLSIKGLRIYKSLAGTEYVDVFGIGVQNGVNNCLTVPKQAIILLAKKIQEGKL